MNSSPPKMLERAYYRNSIPRFLVTSDSQILGELASKHDFDIEPMQRNAWIRQIDSLKTALAKLESGELFFEFSIPRVGKRADTILLIGGAVFVIEYKMGAADHELHGKNQVLDYALDLKDFHEGSHEKNIVPILVASEAQSKEVSIEWFSDKIAHVLMSNGHDLNDIVNKVLLSIPKQPEILADSWISSGYKPTPTIIEAAQALYQGHSVEEISRSDSGTINLTRTSRCISEIIDSSEKNKRKSICFVTGVPGAGKTLAGLNISTQQLRPGESETAVFLSGNGPLVDVLRESLARDDVRRMRERDTAFTKNKARSQVRTFIQNIHHFRDEALTTENEPAEHVVVFDEAQRAWNQASAEKFMMQKRGLPEFKMSEPQFLISVMDRRQDWSVIVCLVGGGQEINTGEAGLLEWFESIQRNFRHWDVYYPESIKHKEYSWGQNLSTKLTSLRALVIPDLHLAVSIRSYRAEKVSEFVGAVIDGNVNHARNLYAAMENAYPLVLTRDLETARKWLKSKARGNQRFGLVASSGGLRLKAVGINVKSEIDPVNWFLNDETDVRSSFYMEDVATEFDIQGLELDWAGVCWDADFRRRGTEWSLNNFKGTRWQAVKDPYRKAYLANAYRVLMTRARQGMVVFVPKGDSSDHTRLPCFYDETYEFLISCGIMKV